MNTVRFTRQYLHLNFFSLFLPILLLNLTATPPALADASGTFVYTQRFDGESVVLEVDWTYVRATPSLTFGTPRVIWTGAGAPEGAAGSDGLFYTPAGDLVVGNWQNNAFWKFDPTKTDEVVDGPSAGAFPFHQLLHPNMNDFLATPAFGQVACNSGTAACFGVYDHTPLVTDHLCLAPMESATDALLQPVSFIADENLNLFAVYSDGRDCAGCPAGTGIQFGGGGFASFDLDTTTSTSCSNNMKMTSLIPQEISAAHSISWDPFLSDANRANNPHSDFIVFANSKISQIRVTNPGTPGATASVVATVDMATESNCASLLPSGMNEFDQGAVNGEGIALVGDESTGFIALVDYSQNSNGTIRDPGDMVCLTAFLSDGIDDIGPLTGLGAKQFFGDAGVQINAGMNDAWFNLSTAGQGVFVVVFPVLGKIFIAMFTYDTERPAGNIAANLGEPGHRWWTAFGDYSGDTAVLEAELTSGGVFNSPNPAVTQTPNYGTVTLKWTDCSNLTMTYNFPGLGLMGEIKMVRVAPDNVALCEALSSP